MSRMEIKEFQKFDELLHPKSVAVVGASPKPTSIGYAYVEHLLDHFEGKIFPVNPQYEEVLGLDVYSNITEISDSVDFVISCVPAKLVPQLLDDCHEKNVKLIHLYTARMSETGREKRVKLERKIEKKAEKLGIRILGPNCMGVYYPDAGLSFGYDFPMEDSGGVGGIFQSGGLATDFIRYGALRGLRFSKIISYGNALDIDESELLYYLAQDSETEVIVLYVEGVEDGRKFLDALSYATQRKPVIVLKGGRGEAGARSTSSHTASVAGDIEIWRSIFNQCSAVEVTNFWELIDQVVAFQFLEPETGNRLAVAGGSGGPSVLSADLFDEEGFKLPSVPEEMRQKLKEMDVGAWDWLENPMDISITGGAASPEDLLKMFGKFENVDFLALQIATSDPFPNEIWRSIIEDRMDKTFDLKNEDIPLLVIFKASDVNSEQMKEWRWEKLGELKSQIIDAGIPVFPSPDRAAKALKRFTNYWKKRTDKG